MKSFRIAGILGEDAAGDPVPANSAYSRQETQPSAMRHRIVQQDGDFARLRDAWNALLATTSKPLLPLRWEWFDAWWQSFHRGEAPARAGSLAVHVFEDDTGLRAIVPMVRMTTRMRGIRVRAMSAMANGNTPLWDAILHPDLGERDIDRIGRTLMATPEMDVLLLRRLADDSRLLPWARNITAPLGRWGIRDTIRTPVVQATGDWVDYLATRSRKYRKGIRKKVRDFEARAGATLEFVPLATGREPAMDEVISISGRSWKTRVRNDLASNAAGRAFLERLVGHLGPRGDAGVWLARVDGRAVAYELHLKYGETTYPIRADMDETFRDLSPGSVLEYHALKAAFDDPGITTYDTCAANYRYLRNLTERARYIHELELFTLTAKARALYALEYLAIPALRRMRDHVRQEQQTA